MFFVAFFFNLIFGFFKPQYIFETLKTLYKLFSSHRKIKKISTDICSKFYSYCIYSFPETNIVLHTHTYQNVVRVIISSLYIWFDSLYMSTYMPYRHFRRKCFSPKIWHEQVPAARIHSISYIPLPRETFTKKQFVIRWESNEIKKKYIKYNLLKENEFMLYI